VNAKRLTLLTAAGLAVSGCGATAALDSASRATPTAAARSAAGPTALPAIATAAPTPVPAPAPPPPPPAQVVVTAAEDDFSGSTFQVTLVSTDGTVLASTAVPSDARWTVGAGAGAAYWVTGGKLQSLDTHGVVKTLATVPSNEAGRVVVSPDGTEVAYATMTQSSKGVATNRLYRVGSGTSVLIAQRIADPAHPSPDAPPAWQYYPMFWSVRGILVERQPLGGCGCGTPFDMQMSAGYSAFIDPATGAASPVSESNTCPLSGAAPNGVAACFEQSSTGGSASIDFHYNMNMISHVALSGMTLGGEATFNGYNVAYTTVPKNAGGCGGPDWRPLTTLHIMDFPTGDDAVAAGPTGFAPQAWLRDGTTIVGTISVAARSSTGSTTSTVVVLNPVTGHVSTILNQSAVVVGLA
jgi:hypothetical protein